MANILYSSITIKFLYFTNNNESELGDNKKHGLFTVVTFRTIVFECLVDDAEHHEDMEDNLIIRTCIYFKLLQ